VETAAYFVVAEALANAAKHAHAERVEIRIAHTGDKLELQVEDDGAGRADPNGTGLRGMWSRVEALDGKLSVTSPPARGDRRASGVHVLLTSPAPNNHR
jgi:signal transduction histidine kinase